MSESLELNWTTPWSLQKAIRVINCGIDFEVNYAFLSEDTACQQITNISKFRISSFYSALLLINSLSLREGKSKKKFGKYLSTCFSPGRVCNWLIHRSTTGVLKYFTSWRQTKLNFSILAFMGLSIFRLGCNFLVRDALLHQLCSLFEHCSKRLWPTRPRPSLSFFFLCTALRLNKIRYRSKCPKI